MKKFMLCADDYGMSWGVSSAILALAQEKRLSSTSCMTNFRTWQDHARELPELKGHIDVGLHLNLTLGHSLVSAGGMELLNIVQLARRAVLHQLDIRTIEHEINAQCAAFEDAMQCQPDFIDGHQHAHSLPVIRKILMQVIKKRYPDKKPLVRDPGDTLKNIVHRRSSIKKAVLVKMLSYGLENLATQAGIPVNKGFSGYSSFNVDREYADDFKKFLTAMGSRHLIMCHPGHIDDDLRKLDPVVDTRPLEYDFFKGHQFTEICEQRNLSLQRIAEVL